MADRVGLKKQITLLQGVSIIVGIIIGSGIFVSPVGILQNVHSVGLSLTMWAVCGVFSTLCALCYAELGTSISTSGGEYAYVKEAFGDYPGFLCLWLDTIVVCPVSLAASSLTFASYVTRSIFPDCEPPMIATQLLTALMLLLLVAVNVRNVNWAARVQVIITGSKLIALLLIVVIGGMWITRGHVENFYQPFSGSVVTGESLVMAMYSGYWAFSGWDCLCFLTDELVEPHKNLPRAIVISMVTVMIAYLVVNAAYFAVLSPSDMLQSQSSAVAVAFLEGSFPVISWIMPVLIALSVSGSINGMTLSLSRLFWAGAVNGHFPSVIGMINIKRNTPSPALFVLLLLSLAFQMSGDLFFLIELSGFAGFVIISAVFAGQVYMRFTRPNLHRPIKMPIVIPIILVLLCVAAMAVTIYQRPVEAASSLIVMASSVPVYFVCIKWKNKPRSLTRFSEKVTVALQKLLLVAQADDYAE